MCLAGRKGVGGVGHLIHGTTFWPIGWAAAVGECVSQRQGVCLQLCECKTARKKENKQKQKSGEICESIQAKSRLATVYFS